MKTTQISTPAEWLPRRMVVTGYYDGPTEGIVDLGEHGGVYCFKAMAFDFDRERRVLRLVRVASDRVESVVDTLASMLGPPRWPYWVPTWTFSDDTTQRAVEKQLDDLCASGRAVMAVLTDDTTEKCFGVRQIDETNENATDWLALF